MASTWSRMQWTSLARANSPGFSRLAHFVFAERYAGTRTFHLHQQQQQQQQRHGRGILGSGARKFLTCTALATATGLGYVLYKYNRTDDIRQEIKNLAIPDVHAISLSSSDGNRGKFNFIADAVELCAPAVVYIEVGINRKKDFFGKHPSTTSNGSGFIVSEDGLILTNAHVVVNGPNTTVKVQLYDGSMYAGIVEDVDLQSDLATVRINRTNLPVMKLGSSATIRPGEFVVAIGSPLALSNTITSGVVSSVNRQIQEQDKRQMGYIQTDAAITFGNSGGPLVNLNGEAIGINAMKVTPGISFAIPIDYAKEFLKKAQIRKTDKNASFKEIKRRYLGITMQSLTSNLLNEIHEYSKYANVQHGVFVWRVIYGSPADMAGLQPGDIVTHANNKPVLDSNTIYKILEKPGIINLQIIRGGEILYIQVNPDNIY